jgi:hypothetical protein
MKVWNFFTWLWKPTPKRNMISTRAIAHARKEHICPQCSRTIFPGTSYFKKVYLTCGKIDEEKYCSKCDS